MGLLRLLKRTSPNVLFHDLVKTTIEEKSLLKAYKRIIVETCCEDNPITSAIYKAGKRSGFKEGYECASNEYQQKLLQQADEFLAQKKILKENEEKYNALLDECEKEIERLKNENSKTKQECEYLKLLLKKQKKLKKMGE